MVNCYIYFSASNLLQREKDEVGGVLANLTNWTNSEWLNLLFHCWLVAKEKDRGRRCIGRSKRTKIKMQHVWLLTVRICSCCCFHRCYCWGVVDFLDSSQRLIVEMFLLRVGCLGGLMVGWCVSAFLACQNGKNAARDVACISACFCWRNHCYFDTPNG